MSYEFYKILHLTGIILLFSGLTGLLTVRVLGIEITGKAKSIVFISHGIGSLITLVGGFGLLARLGIIGGLPLWVYGKLLIWLILGGAIALVKRKGHIGWPLFISLILFFIVANYLALTKPFMV